VLAAHVTHVGKPANADEPDAADPDDQAYHLVAFPTMAGPWQAISATRSAWGSGMMDGKAGMAGRATSGGTVFGVLRDTATSAAMRTDHGNRQEVLPRRERPFKLVRAPRQHVKRNPPLLVGREGVVPGRRTGIPPMGDSGAETASLVTHKGRAERENA
jgi:hypothetical protein